MADAMLCADCGPPVPAAVLVVVPDLYRMVRALCGLHGALRAYEQVIPLDSPEAADVLSTHTLLQGFHVPLPRGSAASGG